MISILTLRPLSCLSLSILCLLAANFGHAAESRRCQSIKGEFGSLEGNRQTVPFAYQLELTPGTAWEDVMETVESELVNQMLPYTFRECTEDELITDAIVGVKSSLHDEPVDGVACTAVTSPSNICFVVKGHLDVFVAESHDMASIVRQAIHMDMHAVLDHHSVDHVTDEVVAVSFVDVATLPPETEGTEPENRSYDAMIYAGSAATFFVGLVLLWCQRRNSAEDYLPLSENHEEL